MDGTIKYNGDTADSGKFIVQKVVNFVSELEVHSALLTVYETFLFAFNATTGGHHGYGKAANKESEEYLNMNDKLLNKVCVRGDSVHDTYMMAVLSGCLLVSE